MLVRAEPRPRSFVITSCIALGLALALFGSACATKKKQKLEANLALLAGDTGPS